MPTDFCNLVLIDFCWDWWHFFCRVVTFVWNHHYFCVWMFFCSPISYSCVGMIALSFAKSRLIVSWEWMYLGYIWWAHSSINFALFWDFNFNSRWYNVFCTKKFSHECVLLNFTLKDKKIVILTPFSWKKWLFESLWSSSSSSLSNQLSLWRALSAIFRQLRASSGLI